MTWYQWVVFIVLIILDLYLFWQLLFLRGCLIALRHELDIKESEIKNKNIELKYLLEKLEEKSKILADLTEK